MNHPVSTLELAVRSVDEALDPEGSPLTQPRIHPDVAHALRARAERLPRNAPFSIELLVPPADAARQAEVETAIRRHFSEEEAEAEETLRELGRKGFWSFLIAMGAVGLFVLLSEAVLRLGEGRLFTVLSESLIIVAWVTLWGPAETLLFARFPARRQRRLARALAAAPVKLRAG